MTLREIAGPRWLLSALLITGAALESTPLVIVAVVVSLALAVLTWLRDDRVLLLATGAFATVVAVFDIAEVARQRQEPRPGLAALAAVLALVHVATALVAAQRTTTAPA